MEEGITLVAKTCQHCNSYNVDKNGHRENCPVSDKNGNTIGLPIMKVAQKNKKSKVVNALLQLIRTVKSQEIEIKKQEERIKKLENR